MAIVQSLSCLALRQIFGGIGEIAGVEAGHAAGDAVGKFLSRHLTDHSQKLPLALTRANESAWKALEIALAGESLWSWLDRAENKAFRAQVRAFLNATPLAGLPGHGPEFRQQCLKELRDARKANLIPGSLDAAALTQQAGQFARYADPQALLDAENATLTDLATEFRQANYGTLAHLVALQVGGSGGVTVLVAAVRYFFRREVETDRELFQGLTFAKLDGLQQAQEQGFNALADALAASAADLDAMLTSVHEVVVQTHGVVVDIQKEVNKLAEKLDLLHREVRPRDSLSINDEGERRLVKQLVARYRGLPADQRDKFPDLLNAVGKLEVAAGDFDAAQRDFVEAARINPDVAGKAEAHHNAYGAALERGDFATALVELQKAVALDARRFAPFPNRYEPERILGMGGFGVAFLCQNRHTGGRVVIKTLRSDSLDRNVSDVFREARVLEDLEHPAIIRLRDCDYADPAGTRPFLVMDYFEGTTLADYVEQNGALTPERLLPLARTVAEALRVAHERGIYHRDIKPANLLVRPDGDGWRVKLIDFGLALKQSVLNTSLASSTRGRTVLGYSIAGTIDYAAPEQLGRLPGVTIGPHTDVYGFGKTCCYALFKTVNPLRKHWNNVPEALADLLEQCLHETPQERLPNFDKVLAALAPPPPVVPQPVKPAPAVTTTATATGLATATVSATGPTTVVIDGSKREWWKLRPRQGGAPALSARGQRFEGHDDAVLSVAFSPDGRRVLSGSADATVRLWDAESGEQINVLSGHSDKVWTAVFLPDGKRAVSAGKDKSVRVWDLERGREIRCYENRTNRGLAVSPDGTLALTGSLSDGMVRLWQVDTGRELARFKGHMSWVLGLAFTPDGKQALTSSADGTVRLWEVNGGRELRRLQGHKDQVQCVAAGAGGRQALSGGVDRTVRLWDLKSGKQLRAFEAEVDQLWCVTFSPDGWLAAWEGPNWTVTVRDSDGGDEVRRFQGHAARVMSVAFAPDGRRLVSGGVDKALCVWQLEE